MRKGWRGWLVGSTALLPTHGLDYPPGFWLGTPPADRSLWPRAPLGYEAHALYIGPETVAEARVAFDTWRRGYAPEHASPGVERIGLEPLLLGVDARAGAATPPGVEVLVGGQDVGGLVGGPRGLRVRMPPRLAPHRNAYSPGEPASDTPRTRRSPKRAKAGRNIAYLGHVLTLGNK